MYKKSDCELKNKNQNIARLKNRNSGKNTHVDSNNYYIESRITI